MKRSQFQYKQAIDTVQAHRGNITKGWRFFPPRNAMVLICSPLFLLVSCFCIFLLGVFSFFFSLKKKTTTAAQLAKYVPAKIKQFVFDEIANILSGQAPLEPPLPTEDQIAAAEEARPESQFEYVPGHRTGAWAILLTMYRESSKATCQ